MSTTMTYDAGSRGVVSTNPVPSFTTTNAYDNTSNQIRYLDVHGVVTTCTYDRRNYGFHNEPNATARYEFVGGSLETRLLANLVALLRNPPQSGEPLWWHVWKTLAENPWLHSQQVAVARRFIRQHDLVEEMCQVSTFHLGRSLQRSPTLGLSADAFASEFARRTRTIIRSSVITWLRLLATERRRIAALPAIDVVQVRSIPPTDKLEIATAVAELPPLHRDIIEMRSVGYKRSEIARVLGLSIFQIDRIFSSCRDRLALRLRSFRVE